MTLEDFQTLLNQRGFRVENTWTKNNSGTVGEETFHAKTAVPGLESDGLLEIKLFSPKRNLWNLTLERRHRASGFVSVIERHSASGAITAFVKKIRDFKKEPLY